MKIIVTGSEGFLGTELRKLLGRSHEVIRCDLKRGHDITDVNSFASLFNDDIDACVHLAAVSNLNIYDDDKKAGGDINVTGTKNIMDLCDRYKIKLFVASTCCLYGDNGVRVATERSTVSPTEDYARSKLACEELIKKHNSDRTLITAVSMRLATFYGGRYARRALAISIAIEKLVDGQPFMVHGNGNMARTYTHVLDVASGIATLVVNKDILRYDTYNITVEHSKTVWDILSEVSKHCPSRTASFKLTSNRPTPFSQRIIANSRLKALGWEPKWTWERGIKEAVNTYVKVNKKKWLR